MPFTKPLKADDSVEIVRMIARISNLLLELRSEYERRPNPQILLQVKERAAELYELAAHLPGDVTPNVAPPALPPA